MTRATATLIMKADEFGRTRRLAGHDLVNGYLDKPVSFGRIEYRDRVRHPEGWVLSGSHDYEIPPVPDRFIPASIRAEFRPCGSAESKSGVVVVIGDRKPQYIAWRDLIGAAIQDQSKTAETYGAILTAALHASHKVEQIQRKEFAATRAARERVMGRE